MIEAVLVAQIPIIAWLILTISNNGATKLFSEVPYLESRLLPFCLLIALFLFFIDKLLEKTKIVWLNIILNLSLSFFSVALAYQLMYFFKALELIKFSMLGWELWIVPFLITLYRLYASFQTNKIAGLLQEKELELSKQKELKFKSDLNALQARINPHFLYNALNSLASLAHIDSGRTEKMALSLSKLFRYNINKKEEHYAPLQEEIEMASIYLEIEKNRFEDKLNYTIIIPKFILQPLAENAVKHGISKITGKGMIRINIFGEANKVIIEIYDNGPEFPGGLISGYGLQNTYEKLKLLYKKPFDISFINTPEKKLMITLTK
jgi:two-component system LytT family sensor kinase